MNLHYRVELSAEERGELEKLLNAGQHPVRKLKRAQILLATDAGVSHQQIARTVVVSLSTVYRTEQRFVEGNLPWALSERSQRAHCASSRGRRKRCWWRRRVPRSLTARARWTLELLAGEMMRLTEHESVSREPYVGVWQKMSSSRGGGIWDDGVCSGGGGQDAGESGGSVIRVRRFAPGFR